MLAMVRNDHGMEAVTVGVALAVVVLVAVAGYAALATFGHHEAAPASSPEPTVTVSVQHGVGSANEADDAATQADLRNALFAAKTYFTEQASYTGFGPATASRFETSVRYTAEGPADIGVVSIRSVTTTSVLLVERSASGAVFCVADANGVTTYGSVDAASAAACRGGW